MKIAFTHNLKTKNTEEEAEFDTKETIYVIAQALKEIGHQVELVEVSGPVSQSIAKLEMLNPDLVFNTAEGKFGKYREAFYPAIFEQLGLPYTGSDAYVCSLTLDKNLTKSVVSELGIPCPKSILINNRSQLKKIDLRFPVIAKPNFEGSSKGISENSIASTLEELQEKVSMLLGSYPAGILVEEFIYGKDIAVPYIDGISLQTEGVLEPIEYVFSERVVSERTFVIYDYELKNELANEVSVRVPADLPQNVKEKMAKYSAMIFKKLGVADMGRIDFRVTPNGDVFFIEINALPSLEPGAGIYSSAKIAGLPELKDVIGAIVNNAAKRYKITKKSKPKSKTLRVGFTYNEKRVIPQSDPGTDIEAEFDAPKTLNAIREAIRSYGHEVIDLEATPELPEKLAVSNVDIVFNIAEGIKGRYRESQIPALLELMNIPFTGSDASTLALSLDKALAKRIVRESGVKTPEFVTFITGKEKLPSTMKFPLMVKPIAEGSSKGVLSTSVVLSETELRQVTKEIIERYHQAALVEEFLTGREFTIALLGEKKPRVLPPMEVLFLNKEDKYPVYSYQYKLDYSKELRYQAPAIVDDKLKQQLEKVAKKCFQVLGCRDVARIDVRLDSEGNVHFIECNPLPGLTPDWSDLCLIGNSAGMDYRSLIGEILAPAIRRYKEKKRILLDTVKTNQINTNREESINV